MQTLNHTLNNTVQEVTDRLKAANGYVACENILIEQLLHLSNEGLTKTEKELFMKTLMAHLEEIIASPDHLPWQINLRFAHGFIQLLLRTTQWESWLLTLQNKAQIT